MNKATNVWRAVHSKTGKLHYVVGYYDEEDGRYRRPLTSRERRYNPFGLSVFGNFAYCCHRISEQSARARARKLFGYSKIDNAYGNLGSDYEKKE